jgi:hypothetical protein
MALEMLEPEAWASSSIDLDHPCDAQSIGI